MDLERHAASVPFVRTLGARWLGSDAAGIRMLLPCSSTVCGADGEGRVDLRAVLALMDHAGGAAVYAALPVSLATATLELRFDLVGSLPLPGCNVLAAAAMTADHRGSALVLGQATAGDAATPFIRMTARYIVGSGPGQSPADTAYSTARVHAAVRYAAVSTGSMANFDHTLGGTFSAPGCWRLPFAERLVGSVTLPALHGGVVAAGLLTVAVQAAQCAPALQLSALTVRYLRAARAVTTTFTAQVIKSGARASFVQGQAVQNGREVATVQCLFG